MPCDCAQCREHYRTLGIAYGIPTEDALEEAYREAVKQWHPDLYENFASLRADAEEHFKQIQIAYREVKEHGSAAAAAPVEIAAVKPEDTPFSASFSAPVSDPFAAPSSAPAFTSFSSSAITFGDAPGCEVGPQFSPEAEEIINRHLGKLGMAQAIIDLVGARSHGVSYSQFLLLAASGIMARDSRHNISLLWYRDMGEVILIDKHQSGKTGFSHKFFGALAGGQPPKYELQIYRNNGTHFLSVIDPVDDRVKKVIYDFLLTQKTQVQL
jgi:hypothetical protein